MVRKCSFCEGNGIAPCGQCNGSGWVMELFSGVITSCPAPDMFRIMGKKIFQCPRCKGDRVRICPVCNGLKVIPDVPFKAFKLNHDLEACAMCGRITSEWSFCENCGKIYCIDICWTVSKNGDYYVGFCPKGHTMPYGWLGYI